MQCMVLPSSRAASSAWEGLADHRRASRLPCDRRCQVRAAGVFSGWPAARVGRGVVAVPCHPLAAPCNGQGRRCLPSDPCPLARREHPRRAMALAFPAVPCQDSSTGLETPILEAVTPPHPAQAFPFWRVIGPRHGPAAKLWPDDRGYVQGASPKVAVPLL